MQPEHKHTQDSQLSRKLYYAYIQSMQTHVGSILIKKQSCTHTHTFEKKKSQNGAFRWKFSQTHLPPPDPPNLLAHGITEPRKRAITCVITDYYWQNSLARKFVHMNIHIHMSNSAFIRTCAIALIMTAVVLHP